MSIVVARPLPGYPLVPAHRGRSRRTDSTIIFDGLGSEVRNTAVAAAIVSLAALLAYALWFSPGWPLLAGYALLGALATLSVPLLYRLGGHTLTDELGWLERREAQEHAQMSARLVTLRAELAALGIEEGARQAGTLSALLDDYHAVVETRFLGSRSGPLEYLTTARRVQKHAVQNLTDMVAVGHSLASLGRGEAAGGAGGAPGAATAGPEHEDARTPGGSRADRRSVRTAEQRARLDALLEENRELFDALGDTAVEVANIPSFSRFERIDTLARLTSLAEIASRRGA